MSSSKRKPNWSGAEIEALAQAVLENIRTVKGKFTPALTQETKNKCWIAITERINAVNDSRASRDTSEVKKKWQDISSLTKKKEAERIKHRRVTGGGPAMNEDIKPWEQLIIGTFSKSSLEGVQGGVDSGSPASSSQCHTLLERETSYLFGCQLEAVETTQAAETTQAVGTCEETREEFETVIFENSLPSADGAASYPSIQNKKKRKSPYSVSGNEGDRYKSEFLTLEKEKNRHLKQYREKKLALLENIIKQHDEIIDLQMRSTTALEVIADKFQPQVQIPSPLSVSPIIRFDSAS
ncbi:uncharacterized protein LOC111112026 [Crassostrea virginica]